jgi:hypothetical protein
VADINGFLRESSLREKKLNSYGVLLSLSKAVSKLERNNNSEFDKIKSSVCNSVLSGVMLQAVAIANFSELKNIAIN